MTIANRIDHPLSNRATGGCPRGASKPVERARTGGPASPLRTWTLCVLMIAALAGCETTGSNNETMGTIAGAAAGALIGSQVGGGKGKLAAVIAGGLAGALIGRQIGAYLDAQERDLQSEATASALTNEAPNTQTWSKPEGLKGAVTAGPVATDLSAGDARECRMIEQNVTLEDGRRVVDELRFCRNPDGLWERQA